MAYQYVREPLTAAEADRLANACETPTERLVVWTLLDTGLRISELCNLTAKDVLWQQRQLRFKGKGGPYGKKSKVRVVPMSHRVRALLEHYFALETNFPVKTRRCPGHRQGGGTPYRSFLCWPELRRVVSVRPSRARRHASLAGRADTTPRVQYGVTGTPVWCHRNPGNPALERRINEVLGSHIVEKKSYEEREVGYAM